MKSGTFDSLTRALATSTSRRQAVRRIAGILGVGTLGGGVLAELFPGIALAAGNGNAAHFCNAVFDPGPDRGKCKSDAAHGTGLFTACGNGTQSVCCPTNPDGTCTSYSSATCCSSGQACMNGTCVAACPSGTVQLCNGTCATPCTSFGSPCNGTCGTGTCFIDRDTSLYCDVSPIVFGGLCTSDCVCPTGQMCGGEGACVLVC